MELEKFINPVSDHLKCPICLLVVYDALQVC